MQITRKRLSIAIAASVVAFSAPAMAVTIDFNNINTAENVAPITIGAVTFTAPGGLLDLKASPNGTTAVLGAVNFFNGPFIPLRADIAGGSTTISVDMGDFGGDADSLFLRLYNASNVLLTTTSNLLPAGVTGFKTLTATAAGTAYAIFGGVGSNGSSVYVDNFAYSPGTSIPAPEAASWTMTILGVGLAGAALRRRRTTATV